MFPNIDVIIPCYNAEKTLARAVESVLRQVCLGKVWLIDDGSTDNTLALLEAFAEKYPDRIYVESMPKNSGVAKARNWGTLQADNEFIAFLDADDAYEPGALEVAAATFHFQPDTSVVRLALKPIGLPARYAEHPNFDFAWQHMRMTCGGNVVFRRSFFLACGGFPQDALFRELGGEDGALGIATTRIAKVATLFDEVGVLHYCRDGMHAERLLDAVLFQKVPQCVTEEKIAQANAITDEICRRIEALKCGLNSPKIGIRPLTLTRSEE
ncbi:glycosyltransferase family 2 protein [Rodentibacter haemolyticus]|uniref:Glycosyltransferase family 2 protein n=1 Tax=Rodentibacter haemolyticus TaxID=2778911 RepID=A0ABX6V1T5_9PAST|nr:glycosyltransferase family A protein [Rodentibacter haemolyticus]QPB43694.1 glycosyltransferase family 2 protein [Rodentibacter haemolyticus]